ncbi:unnamed protein product [Schistosoma rodhaini]|uniref:Heterogeneous nuclear ribonucleoprotein U-like protein 1 n=1 Tax=Schistosoma rodhaini TaxID=6188 RepID=A0AA85EQR6_9TREM|nr:unnamed protein product [Schistosoma rodhaini]CAH8682155.1 unnamed protein product [Schistosoma rodhaini]
MSEEIDVSKLKVPELRAELGRRGLNTFGTKQILMDRLNEALKTASPNSDKKQPADPEEQPHLASANLSRQPSQNSGRDVLDSSPKVSPQRGCENGLANEKDSSPGDQHQKPEQENLKRRRSPSHSPRRRSRSRDRDSRRSPRRRSRSPQVKSRMVPEPDNWEESASVFLDTYNCDLNLLIDATSSQAKPLTEGGFSLMWAGVRANYGSVSGRSFFEVRVVKNLPVENYDSLVGGATHVLRVGWSTEDTDFTLGEEPQSFGYGGTGKKSTNNKFTDYGCTFGEGDIVGAFIEWTSVEALLRFSVNGVDQGECFRVQKSQLGEHSALFPHVYVKNVEFACNFGQENQSPWFSPNIPSDDPLSWQQINCLPLSCRVHGRCPPQSKSECEVIMMVGLPGAGKTYFAEQQKTEHREKQYNILGTNLILDKMKVMGIARQRNYHGRWDVLIDKATKCLNTLISMACMRRRNYILDQTNVYPSAQRRKMRPFEGFDNSRGGMMRSGPARGGFPAPNFDSRAGRGAYRGSMDRGNPGYGGPNDTMYNRFDGNAGDAEPIGNAYDMNEVSLSQPPYEGGPMSGGFRGGYGGGGRGVQMQGSRGAPGRGGTSMGRGAIAPGRAANTDRGVDRSQLGRNAPVSGRGGAQPDRDMIGGFPDDSQQYNMYGGAEGYQNPAEEQYPGPPNDDYRNRRFGGPGPYNANALQKPSGGSYSAYQRGNPPFSGGPAGYPNAPGGGYNRGSLPSYGNPNSASNYPNSYTGDQGNFTNPSSDPYSGGMASDRSGRPGMQQNSGGPFGGSHAYGTSDPDKTAMSQNEHSSTDSSSLYASGAARYSDNHPSATNIPPGPRQSRFDTKPETNTTSQTSAYNSYALGSSYPGGFTSNGNQKATIQPSNPPGGPRSGRSRFDVGPPASQPIPPAAPVQSTTYNPPSQSVNRPQPQVQQTATSTQQAQPQSYGYGYSTQNAKPDGSSNQNAPPVSQSYGAYNYGYGYGTYGSQTAQPSATVSRCAPTTGTTQQSLYASAVADKPQLTQQTAAPAVSSATTTTATSDHSTPAAAAYASYYYGAPQSATGSTQGAGKYDAAMAAAQQFNAWQQQQQPSAVSGSVSSSVPSAPTATVTPTANPYASYYPGYSTYPSGYGTIPVGGAPPGGVPTAAAPPAMSQYYTGYR